MAVFDRNFEEIISSQMVCTLVGLFSGTMLAIYLQKTLLVPGMLILLPGFLEMRGNISGSFASRLSSGLFLGVIRPDRYRTKIIKGNLTASFLLAIFISLMLGVMAFLFSLFVFGIFAPHIILIPVAAGIIANVIEIPLTLFTTFYLFRKGHDPNNIMGSLVTSTGDITSILSLLFVMVMI